MSKKYTFTRPYEDAYEIVDRDIDKALNPEDVANLLNQQAQRISELEEQLEYFSKRDEEQEQQLEKQAKFRINSIKEYQQENQKLKNRWQKLKEYVYNRTSYVLYAESDSKASRIAQANRIYEVILKLEEGRNDKG